MKRNYLIVIALSALFLTFIGFFKTDKIINKPIRKVVTENKGKTTDEIRKEAFLKKVRKRRNGQKENKFDRPDKFREYYNLIRTRYGEKAPSYESNYKMKAMKKAKANNNVNALRTQSLSFTEHGPANTAGRARGVVVVPTDPTGNTWVSGAVGGGIWKTTTGGTSWELKTADFPTLAVSWIDICLSQPNVLYAATGEVIGGSVGIIGNGVWKSIDEGETWTQLASTTDNIVFSKINRIIVDPDNPDNVLLCTSQGQWEDEFRSGIFKSTDGGNTWNQVFTPIAWVSQLIADPNDFNTIYASLWSRGVLKSTDMGETWTLYNQGFSRLTGRIELAIAQNNTEILYALAEGNENGSGSDIYMSINGGSSWELIEQQYESTYVDYLGGQGSYDNTIVVNPYNDSIVYYGGVSLWRSIIGDETQEVQRVTINLSSKLSDSKWDFVNFGAPFSGGILEGDTTTFGADNMVKVEVRTGDGVGQFAHRFTVNKRGSGVPDPDYEYQDYVEVPFEVWDVTNNQQLMVSFRDQQEDGTFNLINQNTDAGDEENHSREYIFINYIPYSEDPDTNIAKDGGHIEEQMYFFWPVLSEGENWDGDNLPSDTILIDPINESANIRFADLEIVSDAYNEFTGKNNAFEEEGFGFHPDHHNLIAIKTNETAEEFRILNANDGGVWISGSDTDPGILDGEWIYSGVGLNTAQFYGADKSPDVDRFIGGMQDNGTWVSPVNESADENTNYVFSIPGDGFNAVWNYNDANKLIGSFQFNGFRRSLDGGETWENATSGLSGDGPFISKIVTNDSRPNTIYTVSSNGVFRSDNFGGTWTGTPIEENFGFSGFMEVDVSLSNVDIVWAGVGMTEDNNLHVSVDGAQTFTITNNYTEATLGNLSGFSTHPYEDSTAYALFSFSKGPKILRTKDLGQTWEDISGFNSNTESDNGFPDVAVFSLLVRPDDPTILWAGTEIGIFESLDNGLSWNYLPNDMGAVAVFDMTVVDDKIVLATHGRGIWTAQLPEAVEVSYIPEIENVAPTLNNDLTIYSIFNSSYDSTQIIVDEVYVGSINETVVGRGSITVNSYSFTEGQNIDVQLISFKDGKKLPSDIYNVTLLNYLDPVEIYVNDFETNSEDFFGNGFSIRNEVNFTDRAIHSLHDYEIDESLSGSGLNYTYYLRYPIIVKSDLPIIFFDEIAIIEPGLDDSDFVNPDFKDYVIVEASKDGLNWEPLSDGYDARKEDAWLSLYNSNLNGRENNFVSRELNILPTFSVGDTIVIRFRLYSDTETTAWGWAIDDLSIQTEPRVTDLSPNNGFQLKVYPNPTKDLITIQNSGSEILEADIQIYTINGNLVDSKEIVGNTNNSTTINVSNLSTGLYFINISSKQVSKVVKFIKE
ncbi:MAG TPA: hypothetical protein DDY13_07125 [Cytophagales bacterium]|jgi:hypothetical protein|nr:hypothetical protein [Cytophagales bacterium]